MGITEMIFVILFCIGVMIKPVMGPGGGLLSVFAGILLLGFYVFFGFAVLNNIKPKEVFRSTSYKGLNGVNIIVAIVCSIVLAINIVMIVLNLNRWPGGGFLRFSLLPINVLILVTSIILSARKVPLGKNIMLRIIPAILFNAFCIWYYATLPTTL